MSTEAAPKTRRHQRISLPKGMTVAWYGGGDSQLSRVFLAASAVWPVGAKLTLLFEVPGGFV